jgi:hypothetical protein
MNTWLSVGEGLIAPAIAVIGSVFTYTANRRAEYDCVLAPTVELVSRKAVTPSAKRSRQYQSWSVVLDENEIAALFRVLRYVQRTDALCSRCVPLCVQDMSVASRLFTTLGATDVSSAR